MIMSVSMFALSKGAAMPARRSKGRMVRSVRHRRSRQRSPPRPPRRDSRDGYVRRVPGVRRNCGWRRSEEHTSELQSLMRISYAVFCLKKKKKTTMTKKRQNKYKKNKAQQKIKLMNENEKIMIAVIDHD